MESLNAFLRSSGNGLRAAKDYLYFYGRLCLNYVPTIVYQMGKVGSASVIESLESHGVHFVFHVHRMNPDNIRRVRQERLNANRRPPNDMPGRRLYDNVVSKRKKAKFITLVREPIGRNISAFFQNFSVLTETEYEDASFTIGELVDIFIKDYTHAVPLTWFDVEMKQTLGIDVYEHPFPKEEGHLVINEGDFELLILKSEVDDSVKQDAIAKFLGMEDFRLVRSNVGQAKNYAETYRAFRQTIRLPASYVEIMCNSEYIRHFYSGVEIASIRSKWEHRIQQTELPLPVYQELLKASSRVVDWL
jgi:hypothetical protein